MIFFVAVQRHHDAQQVRYWFVVWRMEIDALLRAHEQCQRTCDPAYPGVGNGKPIAKRCRCGLLAPQQGSENGTWVESVCSADRVRDELERASLIAHVNVEQYLLGLQPARYLRDVVWH